MGILSMHRVQLFAALLLQLCALYRAEPSLQQRVQGLSALLAGFKTENEQCSAKVKHMLNQFIQDDSILVGLLNSGRGVNQLGNYKECVNTHGRYILFSIKNTPVLFTLGICGPAECAAADYQPLKKPVSEFMTTLMKSLGTKIIVTENDVLFVDTDEESDKYDRVSPGSVITLVMVSAFVLLSIVGSAMAIRSPEIAKSSRALDKLIYSFDIRRNAEALVRIEQKHDTGLKVFDGVRVIGMLWIVLGHSLMAAAITPTQNLASLQPFTSDFSKAHLYNAFLAVDIFFFLSGFLICFVLISSIATRLSWKLYLHRLIRLYPALIVSYCLYCYILPLFAQGPRFYKYLKMVNVDCKEQVPDIFFFFYNYRNEDYDCTGWVWYVSVDMQFFVITPPIIYILAKWPRIGVCVLLTMLVGSYASTAVVASVYDIHAALEKNNKDYSRLYYSAPYARIPPYLLGIIFAYWYLQAKRKEKSLSQFLWELVSDSAIVRAFCYLGGAAGVFFAIHLQYWVNKDYGRAFDMTYLVGDRSFFIVSLFLLCLPSMAGKGRVMNRLLANPLMSILAKLTYGVYMTHQALLEYFCYSQYVSTFLSYDALLFWFCSYATMSYIVAFFLYMLIEAPIFNMEDAFLRVRGRPAAKKEPITAGTEEKGPLLGTKSDTADSATNKDTTTQS